MEWTTLGTVTPVLDWTLFSIATDAEVFRLTHSSSIPSKWRPRALIGQFYSNNEALIGSIVYPRSGVREILELRIPEELSATGAIVRQIGLRILPPRWGGSYSYDWSVNLEALQVSVTSVELSDVIAEIEETEIDIRGDITQLRSDLGL